MSNIFLYSLIISNPSSDYFDNLIDAFEILNDFDQTTNTFSVFNDRNVFKTVVLTGTSDKTNLYTTSPTNVEATIISSQVDEEVRLKLFYLFLY